VARQTRARIEKSAGGVVVRHIGGVPHVLVIRDPYRNWGLPKGHLENGEGPGEAAVREVAEETGLADLTLGGELATIDWHFRSGGRLVHKFCVFYLMSSEEGEPTPEIAEGITECLWVRLADAESHITYDNAREVVRLARDELDSAAPSDRGG